ncbi:MAG TPA: 16S rRNA (guanine(527)-N(7))-methyltransferase RsmG [Mycobacteriales bacterium]|nr:16S rRNA (guanine(527)-N(7))-methyltransferase RsmG [Mycobacteriales bacterium]
MSAAAAASGPANGSASGPVPAAAREVFGAGVELAQRYAELLAGEGIIRGVIGPGEATRIWSRHLLNSAALAALVPDAVRVADLGSGAGLPGIPLAIARPDLSLVLVEPMARRVRFLRDCIGALGLDSVEIVHARAEAGLEPPPDVVVARAVAPLHRLIGLARALARPGGELLALKGASAAEELRELPAGTDAELISVVLGGVPATVVRVRSLDRSGARASGGGR